MYKLSATEIQDQFVKGSLSAKEIATYTINRIEKFDKEVGSFLCTYSQRLEKKASELDKKREEKKPLGLLAGVPIAIKDNIHVNSEITTCGSKFLSNYRAVFTSTVVRLLEKEDALIIGKTNLDEFAMGSSTENSAYHKTKNPWNLSCSPGGSSGGSAAAVAARFCPLSLGSDTGGSIRQPAAFCGVVGFKPTYGRVSRYGLVAFASSLDQIGPFATSVTDTARIMQVIGQHCEKDSTSSHIPTPDFIGSLSPTMEGVKIGVPWHFLEDLSDEVKSNFIESIETCKSLGATIVDIDLDILKYSIAVYYVLATAEASTNLARFDGIRYGVRSPRAKTLDEVYEYSKQEGFGSEVKNRILLGTYVLSSGYKDAYYKQSQKVRTLMMQAVATAFSKCHIIALPTSPFPTFPLGSIQDPLQMYLQDIYTIGANLVGSPAISIPCGFTKDLKPLGLQLMGPLMHDAKVLSCAYAFEQATAYSKIPTSFDKEARA